MGKPFVAPATYTITWWCLGCGIANKTSVDKGDSGFVACCAKCGRVTSMNVSLPVRPAPGRAGEGGEG